MRPTESVSAEGGSSFLAYNRETGSNRYVLDRCPKEGWILVDRVSGVVVRPAPCGRNGCPIHGPNKASATAVAVDLVGPERFVLLTGLRSTHEERVEQRKVFRRYLRRLGYEYEVWGVVERHKSGEHHAHEWQRGDFLPVETLRRAATGAGMGSWVGIKKWEKRAGGGRGTLYGVKAVSRAGTLYGVKEAARGHLEGFLEDNGGRYGYWTRGFFGQGYADARREALRSVAGAGAPEGNWTLMREVIPDA